MPDISMSTSETCELAASCYRNPKSGTKPGEYRQAYFFGLKLEGKDCHHYWHRASKDKQSNLNKDYHND